jgi:hypothetical protein
MSTTKTKQVPTEVAAEQIRKQNAIGDCLFDKWQKNDDLKTIQTALVAYRNATYAAKTQVIYKKETGSPVKINYLEE